jgi:hypothetical protein
LDQPHEQARIYASCEESGAAGIPELSNAVLAKGHDFPSGRSGRLKHPAPQGDMIMTFSLPQVKWLRVPAFAGSTPADASI